MSEWYYPIRSVETGLWINYLRMITNFRALRHAELDVVFYYPVEIVTIPD